MINEPSVTSIVGPGRITRSGMMFDHTPTHNEDIDSLAKSKGK